MVIPAQGSFHKGSDRPQGYGIKGQWNETTLMANISITDIVGEGSCDDSNIYEYCMLRVRTGT